MSKENFFLAKTNSHKMCIGTGVQVGFFLPSHSYLNCGEARQQKYTICCTVSLLRPLDNLKR